jgi:trehalose 6-phosphate synthase/phosphatase
VNNVDAWAQAFLKTIRSTTSMDPESDSKKGSCLMSSAMDDYDEYLSKYVGNAEKLALLLDYDGTLAPLAPHPDLAILPNETRKILQRLSNCPDVYVSIISNRSVDNVKKMVGIENITYAGKNGLEILHPDGTKFVYPLPVEYEDKVRCLLRKLQEEVCHDGAWVEHKGLLLTYHYR